jgi:hypothetical protein
MEKSSSDQSKEPYLGDLQKTQILGELFLTAHEQRDEAWKNSLLQNVAEASFTCGNPQVIEGPDGFPYFQLLMPEPYKPFTCYVIKNMNEEFLLKQGIGVALFQQNAQRPEWVFSCGDLLNYFLNGEFYAESKIKNSGTEVLQQNEEVLVVQPSEKFLPHVTRNLLRQLMIHHNITDVKLLLMMRTKDEIVSQELVFNLTPDRFQSQQHFESTMRAISWFLPRHYSFCSMNEASFKESFAPL